MSESSSSLEEELPDLSSDCDVLGITEDDREKWIAIDKSRIRLMMVQSSVAEDPEKQEEDEEPGSNAPAIGHSKAEEALSTGLAWLEQQEEATPMN